MTDQFSSVNRETVLSTGDGSAAKTGPLDHSLNPFSQNQYSELVNQRSSVGSTGGRRIIKSSVESMVVEISIPPKLSFEKNKDKFYEQLQKL